MAAATETGRNTLNEAATYEFISLTDGNSNSTLFTKLDKPIVAWFQPTSATSVVGCAINTSTNQITLGSVGGGPLAGTVVVIGA